MHVDTEHGLQQSRLQDLQRAAGHGGLRLDLHHLLSLLFLAGLPLLGTGH